MAKLSRRKLIAQASTGAAAIGALSLAPNLAAAAPRTNARQGGDQTQSIDVSGPMAVLVLNPRSGNITFLVDSQEVTVNDPDLVARMKAALQ
ncbi:MAG TPA: hypothetical protein VFI42_07050 [Thermomicrobiaceae bacterium]|nr:hypothetical protein [Thermomicrobiaceae bacterium]